jgi:hypothetical protein
MATQPTYTDIDAAVEDIARRTLRLCHRELDRLESLPVHGPDELRALRGVGEMVSEARSLLDLPATGAAQVGYDEADDVAARLAAVASETR